MGSRTSQEEVMTVFCTTGAYGVIWTNVQTTKQYVAQVVCATSRLSLVWSSMTNYQNNTTLLEHNSWAEEWGLKGQSSQSNNKFCILLFRQMTNSTSIRLFDRCLNILVTKHCVLINWNGKWVFTSAIYTSHSVCWGQARLLGLLTQAMSSWITNVVLICPHWMLITHVKRMN